MIDEDTNAFNTVMDANRLPSNSDEEKIAKRKAVLAANKYAIEIPLEAAELSLSVLEIANELVKKVIQILSVMWEYPGGCFWQLFVELA